ncbi:hypothetical protein DFH11DRAFT_1600313 [Phellopilus nigrolimitatus]|nr:hypothetical protein DFH11DRAFT_1600313 [Phellopilus nigrolimitatus]
MVAMISALSAASNAVTPVSGNNYTIQNLAYGHFLDDLGYSSEDNNPVVAWSQNSPETDNQIWTYLTYPTTGDPVFTLQTLIATDNETSYDGRGGYLRTDTNNMIVQTGAPQAWLLQTVSPSIYKFVPHDPYLNINQTMVITDVTNGSTISPPANQLQLTPYTGDTTQHWTFNTPP